MSEGDREPVGDLAERWGEKAEENVEKWGKQDVEVLLLAIQEELGELSQAVLQYRFEEGYYAPIFEELDDLAPLLFQLYWSVSAHNYVTGNEQ